MIFGITDDQRQKIRDHRRSHRRRWRRRFAFIPVQLTSPTWREGQWLWLEWYDVRVFHYTRNARRPAL